MFYILFCIKYGIRLNELSSCKEKNMAIGTVKWFNNAKGFGFITPEGGGEDVFAHFSAIVMDGYRTLEEGMRVEYEPIQGPRGWQANNIQRITTSA